MYILRHVIHFLQETLIIVILVFYLNFPASNSNLFAFIYYQYLTSLLLKSLFLLKMYDGPNKISSINTSITYHISLERNIY